MISCLDFMLAGQDAVQVIGVATVAVAVFVIAHVTKSRMRTRRQPPAVDDTSKPAPEPEPIEPLHNHDWTAAKRRQLRPFKATYHITMAIKTSSPSELITVDEDYLDRVTLRRSLIAKLGNKVHGCVPGGEPLVRELYTYLLGAYLPVRFPGLFRVSADTATFSNLVTGREFPTAPPGNCADAASTDAALRTLGETVEEDLFLLVPKERGHRVVAFMCAFPAGFDPAEKLGRTLAEVHAPVPQYDKIGPSMERFFGKMEVGRNVRRMNWSVQTHRDLYTTDGNHIVMEGEWQSKEKTEDMDSSFLRVELQTVSRLPKTKAILFSFKTYLYPLRELREGGEGPALADAIEGLGNGNAPGMPKYKSAVRWGKPVCEYLRS